MFKTTPCVHEQSPDRGSRQGSQTRLSRWALAVAVGTSMVLGGSLGASAASVPEACRSVTMADVGWTDIQATTGLASVVLQGLGYQPDVKMMSVPVTFVGLGNGDVDAFLGLWMPSMASMVKDRLDKGSIERLRTNLTGAKYTLVVSRAAYDGGVHDFADLDAHKAQFDGKIYGIEPGNDGNQLIEDMIDKDAFGLGDWSLVESSEAGMLLQAKHAIEGGDWIVFLGWAPHPMNTKLDIRYLTGGDDYFGPNQGGATVSTLTRKGFVADCPNVGKLLNQLSFSVEMENHLMGAIMDDKKTAPEAATAYLKAHPDLLDGWLKGVSTVDGKPGLAAVKASLGIK